MYSDRDVHDLVGRIYTAATEPSDWDDFLGAFARIGGGTCAALTHHDHQHGNEATAVEYRDPELDDQGSPAVQSGMSVQMLSELNELDNEYERDREDQ